MTEKRNRKRLERMGNEPFHLPHRANEDRSRRRRRQRNMDTLASTSVVAGRSKAFFAPRLIAKSLQDVDSFQRRDDSIRSHGDETMRRSSDTLA